MKRKLSKTGRKPVVKGSLHKKAPKPKRGLDPGLSGVSSAGNTPGTSGKISHDTPHGGVLDYRRCAQKLICEILGKQPARINQWIARGMPVEAIDGKKYYDPAKILDWRVAYERQLCEDSGAEDSDAASRDDYWAEKTKRERAEAARAARRNRVEAGEVILKSDLRAALLHIAATFRTLVESGEPINRVLDRVEADFNNLCLVKSTKGIDDD
jgi:phage terminase Nu1 subunit (DNA packaging protein)